MRDSIVVRKWLDTAVSGIRFGPDREEVKAELWQHVEDKTAGLMRAFPDMGEKEAQERAVAGMGDPWELRRSLAKVHRPWLGWLWRASQGLAAVLVLLAVWNRAGIGWVFSDGSVSNYVERREEYRERFPHSLSESALDWGQVLAVGEGTERVSVGSYTFSLRRASLLRADIEGESCFYLAFTLRGEGGVPWALPAEDLGRWVQVRDSRSRLYRGEANPDPEGRSQTSCGWSEHGLDWREYEGMTFLYLPGKGTTVKHPSEVEWFQVEFDNGDTRFSIPVQWRETVQ